MKRLIAISVALLAVIVAPSAQAAFGEHYGLIPINGGPGSGTLDVPAIPDSQHLFWAGVCDRGTAPAAGTDLSLSGGIGQVPSTAAAPSNDMAGQGSIVDVPLLDSLRDCIDWRLGLNGTNGSTKPDDLWQPPPGWRLPDLVHAGAHGDGTATMGFVDDGDTDNIIVDLPPGFVGNPGAVPLCTAEQFSVSPSECPPSSQVGVLTIRHLGAGGGGNNFGGAQNVDTIPVYNLEPRQGNAAELGLVQVTKDGRITARLIAKARTNSDFGVTTFIGQIPGSALPINQQQITLWGVPWAAENDVWRAPEGLQRVDACAAQPGVGAGSSNIIPPGGLSPACRQSYEPSWGEIEPFISLETDCNPAPSTLLASDAYQFPGSFIHDGSVALGEPAGLVTPRNGNPDPADPNWKIYSSPAPAVEGCEKLGFAPDITLGPVSAGGGALGAADSPAGLDVELSIPQNNSLPFDPPAVGASQGEIDQYVADAGDHWRSDDGLATAHLKDTTVTLAEGMTLNPAAAAGMSACSTEQIGLTDTDAPTPPSIRFNNAPPACPESSKVGVVEIETPLLEPEDWPTGNVYLAAQGDNPFGSDFAIYIAVRSPERGVTIKLAGEISLDPATGKVTTSFVENPELPFDRFKLRFKGGPRAPLATPVVCGTHTSVNRFASHARPDAPVTVNDPLELNSSPAGGCASAPQDRPFNIGMNAGVASVGAGQYSAFHARFQRGDGQQEFNRITLNTPEGLTGKLAGVPYCPEAGIARAVGRTATGDGALEKADPSCPAASQVGTTTVGAGAGRSPYYVEGNIYLAGPYKGAPLSMVFIVPAIAGPFDLGVQVVRAQLQVDPFTARITTVSDEIPSILRGVPLRVRDIRVDITRPEFIVNPTNCSEQSVYGTIYGASGAETQVGNRFVVDGCRDLGFEPKFRAKILDKGRRSTLRSWNPRTRFTVVPRPGDANIGGARVALPSSTILDQSNLDTTCTRAKMAAEDCPAGSIVGYARAWSPLLDQAVQGPVYLAANGGVRPLPDLVAVLDGQIRVSLLGEISTLRTGGKARLQNTFRVVPDAPVSRFVLTMRGGRDRGLLVNSTDLCRTNERGVAVFRGHNGRQARQRLRVGLSFKGCRKVRKQAARRAAKRKAARNKARRAARAASTARGPA